jgi:cytochrome c553
MRGMLVPVILTFLLGTGIAAAADREFGQHLSAECVTCHKLTGPPVAGVPQIAGWPEDQFVAVMKSYQDKVRENPVMQTIAGRLGAEEVAALAAYFGSIRQAPTKSKARK